MNLQTTSTAALSSLTPEQCRKANEAADLIAMLPQLPVATEHVFHAGMYARTIRLPADAYLAGALIQVATVLIVHGRARFYVDGQAPLDVDGHAVLPCSAGRKTILRTYSDVQMTMLFPTQARTVLAAEMEFTAEYEKLLSARSDNDIVTITGE